MSNNCVLNFKQAESNAIFENVTKGIYCIATGLESPVTSKTILKISNLDNKDEKIFFNCVAQTKLLTSNLLEEVNTGLLPDVFKVELGKGSKKCLHVTNENGTTHLCIQIDYQKMKDKLNLPLQEYVAKESGKSIHIEFLDFGDITSDKTSVKDDAIQKLVGETGTDADFKANAKRRLVLIVDMPVGSSSGAKASSMTTSRAAAVKLAVAADHVKGQGFSASKALASSLDSTHPLVGAVMGLHDESSMADVEDVLDVEATPEEIQEALKQSPEMSSSVLTHYPGGVASRLVDRDETGAVTAALAEIF